MHLLMLLSEDQISFKQFINSTNYYNQKCNSIGPAVLSQLATVVLPGRLSIFGHCLSVVLYAGGWFVNATPLRLCRRLYYN